MPVMSPHPSRTITPIENFLRNNHRLADIQPASLWDSLSLKPGQHHGEYILFHVPMGQIDPWTGEIKTIRHTSMTQAGGMLPAPRSFLVQRILFTFGRDMREEDVYQFAESTVWQFELGQKWYLRSNIISLPTTRNNIKAPIRICEFCRSVYVMEPQCPGCGARQFQLTDLGELPFEEGGRQYYFQIPAGNELAIEQYLPFTLRLYSDAVLTGHLKLWCHIEGLEKRMVQ